jgi:pyruvate decarboxylase
MRLANALGRWQNPVTIADSKPTIRGFNAEVVKATCRNGDNRSSTHQARNLHRVIGIRRVNAGASFLTEPWRSATLSIRGLFEAPLPQTILYKPSSICSTRNLITDRERKAAMSTQDTFTVGKYLAARLEHIGLKHHFVVPGDYNLVLLDQLVSNTNMQQIGCCNELEAAYAAEGYARANGAGALAVTFNVGAFSALNGVAGAYAENLPVIFISSSYNTNDPIEDHILHHTLGTHDLSYQHDIVARVTCEAVHVKHAEDAPHQIDRAIRAALGQRKPAYIEIPVNLSNAPCREPVPLESFSPQERSDPKALAAAVDKAGNLLDGARRPVLLAGGKLRAYNATNAFRELAEALGCGVAVMPDAKGFFPEEHPQFIGVYWGSVSSPGTEPVVNGADMILAAGPVYSDYVTVGWTAQPPQDHTINADIGYVRFPDAEFTVVDLAEFLSALAKNVRKNDATLQQFQNESNRASKAPTAAAAPAEARDSNAPLKMAELVRQIQNDIDANTTLLVETGTSWLEGESMHLPDGARFEIEFLWGSIGWSVPACYGYAMGLEPGRRVVAMIGDGSFRLTAQAMATAIGNGVDNLTVFLVNNRGYVVESAIHDGPYNYYKNWDFAGLMNAFNADDGHGLGLKATTAGELADAIQKARNHRGGPVLIECPIAHDDFNPNLTEWGRKVARANARPPVRVIVGETMHYQEIQ